MIIKGSSRSGPKQLAAHLQRTDTNETVRLLHVDFSASGDLTEALTDMQTMTMGTRGSKGLYHANIDPEAHYEMTDEQWHRAVEVLEEELGLQGQPKAVVMHEKKGRQHLHVVWGRVDMETWTLRSDSMNYPAHERASLKLELEFGHEHTPGKHAKKHLNRDQPTPVAEMNHMEWQQWERTGLHPKERKALVTELYQQSDTGRAFQAALNDNGYILAKGDRRALVIVDSAGDAHSLTRQVNGARAAEIRDKLADIDQDKLPSVEEARKLALELRPRDVSDSDTEKPPLAHETETAISPALQAVHDRHAQEREAFLDEQQLLANSLEKQWQEDRGKAEANIDKRLAAQRQKEYEDVMLRKRRKPANLNEQMQEFWEVLQTRHNPFRALSRKATREKFWFELQPLLDQRDELVKKEAMAKFDARIERERKRLYHQQADELARFEAKQSGELHEAQRKIEDDEARLAREAERAKEIERQLREREQQRQRDKDRDR
jgi:hypothetical protein